MLNTRAATFVHFFIKIILPFIGSDVVYFCSSRIAETEAQND